MSEPVMQQQAQQAQRAAPAAPASPPDVPSVPVTISPGGRITVGEASSPAALYEAARHQRSELRDQRDELQDERRSIIREMQQNNTGPARAGLEQRLTQVDERIVAVNKQLAEADAQVARLAAVPGAVVPPTPVRKPGPPEEFWVISGLILVPSAFILSVAYARRIWRKGAQVVSAIPQEFYDRFTRVEQALDAVAVEVERIGEGQRYLTRALAERQLGAGAAQPVEVRQREGERVAREK